MALLVTLSTPQIDEMVEKRSQYRKQGEFKRADEIRVILANLNIIIEDGKHNTFWYRLSGYQVRDKENIKYFNNKRLKED